MAQTIIEAAYNILSKKSQLSESVSNQTESSDFDQWLDSLPEGVTLQMYAYGPDGEAIDLYEGKIGPKTKKGSQTGKVRMSGRGEDTYYDTEGNVVGYTDSPGMKTTMNGRGEETPFYDRLRTPKPTPKPKVSGKQLQKVGQSTKPVSTAKYVLSYAPVTGDSPNRPNFAKIYKSGRDPHLDKWCDNIVKHPKFSHFEIEHKKAGRSRSYNTSWVHAFDDDGRHLDSYVHVHGEHG